MKLELNQEELNKLSLADLKAIASFNIKPLLYQRFNLDRFDDEKLYQKLDQPSDWIAGNFQMLIDDEIEKRVNKLFNLVEEEK